MSRKKVFFFYIFFSFVVVFTVIFVLKVRLFCGRNTTINPKATGVKEGERKTNESPFLPTYPIPIFFGDFLFPSPKGEPSRAKGWSSKLN